MLVTSGRHKLPHADNRLNTGVGRRFSAFRRLGCKAVGITEECRNKDTIPHIHRPGDTYETVNFDHLGPTTKLIAEVMKILVR